MESEFDSTHKKPNIELIPLLVNKKPLPFKWMFCYKYVAKSNQPKYKYVAKSKKPKYKVQMVAKVLK